MGCDGGSIVGRQELVTLKKTVKPQNSLREVAKDRANTCTLTHEPLKAPVVACALGQLYNKEAVLEYLLSKVKVPLFSHINGLKDILPVTLCWNEGAGKEESKEGEAASSSSTSSSAIASTDPSSQSAALYSCPITSLPSNGVNRFIAMQPCGCVVSERAWKSVGGGGNAAGGASDEKDTVPSCMVCMKPLTIDTPAPVSSDSSSTSSSSAAVSSSTVSPYHHPSYLTLFPQDTEVLYLRAVIAERIKTREQEKAAKKAAKKEKNGASGSAASAAVTANLDTPMTAASAPASSSSSSSAVKTEPSTSSTSPTSHKRKAIDQTVTSSAASSASHIAKKLITPASSSSSSTTAPLTASRTTGNTLSDSVLKITQQAALSTAERRRDPVFNSMFLSQEQKDQQRSASSFISSKTSSCMSLL